MDEQSLEPPDLTSEEIERILKYGVHYSELGLTREQFDEAAAMLEGMEPYWDLPEMDVYNVHLLDMVRRHRGIKPHGDGT